MRNFNLGDLGSWEPVPVGEPVDVPGDGGPRTIQFALMASAPIDVYASDENADRRLVATGDGLLRVRFTGEGLVSMELGGDADTDVFVRQRRDPQVVYGSDVPSYTTIEPRGVGPSQDVKRMMLLMKVNAERREAILRAELEAVRGEQRAERMEAPAPSPRRSKASTEVSEDGAP